MPSPKITVFADKYAKGWPDHAEAPGGEVTDAGFAFEDEYETDAHFVAYESSSGRRLNKGAIDRLDAIVMHVVAIDVDCPKERKQGGSASSEWREDLSRRVKTLADMHPDPFYYETRGGARIVYALKDPFLITNHQEADRWSRSILLTIAYLKDNFGIEADPACADWQRMYRLPHTVRDGALQQLPASGSPHTIAALCVEKVGAETFAGVRWSKAWKPTKTRINLKPAEGQSGEGILYHLLNARGWLGKKQGRDNGILIRCPNEDQHSGGRTGDTSTVLYPPSSGQVVGAIECKHGHCQDFGAADWIKMFTETEIKDARRAAGIEEPLDAAGVLVDLEKHREKNE